MSDKDKLEIIQEMIENYYEYSCDENAAELRMLIDCIDVVVKHEPALFVKSSNENCSCKCGEHTVSLNEHTCPEF